MQNILFKIIIIISLSSFIAPIQGISQELNYDLSIADSLFEKGKYTESFEIYNAILEIGEKVTPVMLLKMAYIKEGLGDHSNALYYLNRYYLKTSNKLVLNKMEELASEHNLSGYSEKEQNLINHYFHENFSKIIIVLSFLTVIVFSLAAYRKFKLKKVPITTSLLGGALLVTIFYLTNFAHTSNQGIIIKQGAFIMSGPSAGASLIDSPQKGHRVKILGETDVWLQITWRGKNGFIKSQFVKPLPY